MSQKGDTTPDIARIARSRYRRRLIAAVILTVVGVATWNLTLRNNQPENLTPPGTVSMNRADTAEEALTQLRTQQTTTDAATRLDAGVIAAQNYHTALDTWEGFTFPGVTVVSGTTGVVLILQDAGTCFTRIVSQTQTTETTNDPSACTTQGQLKLQRSLD